MPEQIENSMIIDGFWMRNESKEIKEKLNGPGYKNIQTGVFIPDGDAFDYVLCQCVEILPEGFLNIKWTQEFKDMLVKWFYSDNWIKEG